MYVSECTCAGLWDFEYTYHSWRALGTPWSVFHKVGVPALFDLWHYPFVAMCVLEYSPEHTTPASL